MELLEAVNTVLPCLGEHVITRIETSKHPTVDLIVAAIERQRKSLLLDGWWFNDTVQTIPVNTDGRIAVPLDTLVARGIDCDVVNRGGFFVDLANNTYYFTRPIKVRILTNWEFNELPEAAALAVTYLAGIEVFNADLGADNALSVMQSYANNNLALLRQENLRSRRYNARTNARKSSSLRTWR
jgi:hypothetical protein